MIKNKVYTVEKEKINPIGVDKNRKDYFYLGETSDYYIMGSVAGGYNECFLKVDILNKEVSIHTKEED